MAMSTQMRPVHELAKRINDKLKATDFSWVKAVEINDEEGTRFFFINAFCLEHTDDNGDWLMVFAEHHNFQVFHMDELTSWQAWSRDDPTDLEEFMKEKGIDNDDKEESKT